MYEFPHWRVPQAPAKPRPISADVFAVTRRINTPSIRLGAALDDPAVERAVAFASLGDRGVLVLDGPLTADASLPAAWITTGRLRPSGLGGLRSMRVSIEITAWSSHASQLWLRPACRTPSRWGRRRSRRYFELAHLAGDHIWRVLNDVPPNELVAAPLAATTEEAA